MIGYIFTTNKNLIWTENGETVHIKLGESYNINSYIIVYTNNIDGLTNTFNKIYEVEIEDNNFTFYTRVKKFKILSEMSILNIVNGIENSRDAFLVTTSHPKFRNLLVNKVKNADIAIKWIAKFPEHRDDLFSIILEKGNCYEIITWINQFPLDRFKLISKINNGYAMTMWANRFPEDIDSLLELNEKLNCLTKSELESILNCR